MVTNQRAEDRYKSDAIVYMIHCMLIFYSFYAVHAGMILQSSEAFLQPCEHADTLFDFLFVRSEVETISYLLLGHAVLFQSYV